MSNSSWKQYGGIQKTDRFHSVGVGTLVADSVLLRQKNTTDFNIVGTLNVNNGDINVAGTGNVFLLAVKSDAYITGKLFYGTTQTTNTNYGYFYGNSITGTFGINSTSVPSNALSTFDIYSSSTTAFSARTIASSVTNILAQNSNLTGLNVSATDGTSSAINYIIGNTSASTISSTSSQLTLTSSNVALTGNNIFVTSASGSIYKTTTGNTLISTLNGNATISTSAITTIDSSAGILLKSKITASNRSVYKNINGELVTIYDISTNPYLYDYYENTVVNSGNALSLITSDSSSSTFLNISTPNRNGFSIGGGTFINDYTRSMGTFGITTVSGNYIPSHTIISGNSVTKYLTCTGINTFVPKSETYVLDINGATRIGNGEVNTMSRMNYEILQMKFSKRSYGYGIAVGSPSSITQQYTQTISYTSNGGKSWSQTNVGVNNLDNQIQSLNTYVYNQNYAFVSSSTNNAGGSSILYYTSNGSSTWSQITDANVGSFAKTFSTMYVYDRTDGSHNLLIAGRNISANPNKNQLFNYITNSAFSITGSITYSAIDISLDIINDSDGSGNFMYIVGNGVQKFNVSGLNPVSLYTIKQGTIYNGVFAFDTSYSIAVGKNIISYTYDASTWTDIGTSVTLNSVYIYDTSYAIAVGVSGAIMYTINGSQSWQTVPSAILNSAGTGSRIINTNNNLRSIFMPELNSFVIADVSTSYVAGNTLGKSKILYGFYPNLFNRSNNKVLDVSGNMEITGDIYINGSGQLKSTNSTFNLLNDTVSTVNIGSAASQINIGGSQSIIQIPGTQINTNDAFMSSRLFVNGDTTLSSRLFVIKDTSLNGNLSVSQTTYLKDLNIDTNSVIYSRAYDTKQSSLYLGSTQNNSVIFIGSRNASIKSTVYVGNLNDTVILQGNVQNQTTIDLLVNSNLIQINDGAISSGSSGGAGIQIRDNNDDLAGYLKVANDMNGYNIKAPSSNNVLRIDVNALTVNSNINSAMVTLKSSYSIFNDSSFDLIVNNNVDANYQGQGNFYVATKTILNDDVSMNSNLFVGGKSRLYGDVSMNSRLFVTSDTSLNGNIYVNKTAIFNSNIAINKTTVASNVVLDVNGNMQVSGIVFQF